MMRPTTIHCLLTTAARRSLRLHRQPSCFYMRPVPGPNRMTNGVIASPLARMIRIQKSCISSNSGGGDDGGSNSSSSSSSSPQDKEVHDKQQQQHQEKKPHLHLPEPNSSAATEVTVDGPATKLDHLGPVVVNVDGTISRINNWGEMAEIEREATLRIIGRRNKDRLAALKEAKKGIE